MPDLNEVYDIVNELIELDEIKNNDFEYSDYKYIYILFAFGPNILMNILTSNSLKIINDINN